VAKRRVVKAHHAVVHNYGTEPFTSNEEKPASNERGMLSSIRVKGRHAYDRLHHMARINFARTYTIEHSVKVYDFGDVVIDDIAVLRIQWQAVVNAETTRAYQYQITSVPEEEGEGGSWEEQPAEEGYEGEQE